VFPGSTDEPVQYGLVDLSELTQLKEEVAALKTEVECLKRAKDDPTFKTTQPDADPSLADVVKITQDMFGTPEVTVEHYQPVWCRRESIGTKGSMRSHRDILEPTGSQLSRKNESRRIHYILWLNREPWSGWC
jgi:hypothetical protein